MKTWVQTILLLLCISSSGYSSSDLSPSNISDLELTAFGTDLLCNASNGDPDGKIDLTITGGVAPYIFNWTTADGSGLDPLIEDQSGLSAGTYLCKVTDVAGNIANVSATITAPKIISIVASATDVTCEDDGMIQTNVAGGVAPYYYTWVKDGTPITAATDNLEGISIGTYTLVVTDANGCTQRDEYIIEKTELEDVSLLFGNDTFCKNSETIILTGGWPIGGTYSGNGVGDDGTFDPVAAGSGTHTISYTYAYDNDCDNSATAELFISDTAPEVISVIICEEELPYNWGTQQLDEPGVYTFDCDVEYTLEVYSSEDITTELSISESDLPYIWNGQEITESGTWINPTVNANGCAYDEILVVTVEPEEVSSTSDLKSETSIYPNPAQDLINVASETKLNLLVTNKLGQSILDTEIQEGNNDINSSNWHNGIYILQFSSGEKHWSEMIVIEK